MKKNIIFLVLIFLNSLNLSVAGINYPLGLEWGEESVIFSAQYEEGFLALHQITEQNLDSKEAYSAFGIMRGIYRANALDNKYSKNEIQSTELKQLLDVLIPATKNPQTAKDYFYRGLFSSPPRLATFAPGMFDNFNHVIDNYPDTAYAKYSYLFLARNYSKINRSNEAIEVLNVYLEKYGETDKLLYTVYYLLSNSYYRLYFTADKSDTQNRTQYANQMINYSNKLINEFPDKKSLTGGALINLAGYYNTEDNTAKSLEYYFKVYNDPAYKGRINSAMKSIIKKYKKAKNYKKANDLLEDAKTRYFSNKKTRKIYKKYKKNLEEIRLFGHDVNDRSKEGRQKYKEKKEEIDAWRKKYEASWDENFNQIKPLPQPGQ
jgi:hypothetical protein